VPVISISCRRLNADEVIRNTELLKSVSYIELVFKDNGIGFDQKYANQIFTIFQRLNDRQSYSGSGIGLALCKKIVNNHHGMISAKSNVGEGAKFYIILPLK
jgi:signal transduction histidine kinase